MARRDLTNFRSVINQVVENPDQVAVAGAEIAESILRQGAEAKVAESVSRAQLDLSSLQNQYQVDFQGDPTAGMAKYKQDRQKIFDGLGKGISPLYRRSWEDTTRNIATRNDATQQAWSLKQTRVNTVASINNSMRNNFSQANNDGQSFGLSDETEIDAFVNFGTSMQTLEDFGTNNLGEITTNAMLENYEDDYMKSFLSGIAETNPLKALRLLESDVVKEHFNDPEQWGKMKKSVETRALNIQNINKDKEVLGILKNENALLTKSLQEPLSYSELQQEFERSGTSKAAQSFFMKANGYSNGKATLSSSGKLQFKTGIYKAITDAGEAENLSSQDLTKFQDMIYQGMDNGALTKTEGADYLNGLLTPVIANKEDFLDSFGRGAWNPFQDNIGFDGLQPILDEVNIAAPEGEELGALGQSINNQNTVELLDLYRNALNIEAKNKGLLVGDILNLPKGERIKVYTKAQDKAKRDFWTGRYPQLSSAEEIPPTIVTEDGSRIKTGLSTGKVSATVSVNRRFMEDANGNKAWVYDDGRVEEIR